MAGKLAPLRSKLGGSMKAGGYTGGISKLGPSKLQPITKNMANKTNKGKGVSTPVGPMPMKPFKPAPTAKTARQTLLGGKKNPPNPARAQRQLNRAVGLGPKKTRL